MNKIYITSVSVISPQSPLTEEALRRFVKPLEARRMGVMLRRAMVTALTALEQADVPCPDAIIGGTGQGQESDTVALLEALRIEGESASQPTHFMQSTHNTVCSQIAIRTKCHGYNSTYSHGGVSFEQALFDAMLQLRAGAASSVLVTANDEESDYASVAMVLQTNPTVEPICILEDVRLQHTQAEAEAVEGKRFSASALAIAETALKLGREREGSIEITNNFGSDSAITLLRTC